MKHYYIKALGYERTEYPKPITSIEFTDLSSDENKDKLGVSIEVRGKIVAVFGIYKEDLRNTVAWFDAK